MTDAVERLHTLARRYCTERYAYWTEIYSRLAAQGKLRKADGYHYTDEALDIFPRYQVLSAMLVEVERLIPGNIPSLGEARELICLAGVAAESPFTRPPHTEVQAKAMAEERESFCRHVLGFPEEGLKDVEPLFYRRALEPREAREAFARVSELWGIDRWYWYPLAETARADVLAVQDRYFYEELGVGRLREILAAHGVVKVWEFREGESDPEYEMELSLLEPQYNGSEGYWCSEEMDWLVYASHESSITLGGRWLLEEVKRAWKNWDERTWTSPFFD